MDIKKFSIVDLIKYFRNISLEEFMDALDSIRDISLDKLNLLFLNASFEIKKVILDDEILFSRVMMIPNNVRGKLLLELLDNSVLDYIFKSPYLSSSVPGKEMLSNYFKKISYDKFDELVKKYNFNFMGDDREIDKFKVSDYLESLIKNNSLYNDVYLCKIKNKYELFIYSKFNILVEVKRNQSNYLYFDDDVYLDYNLLVDINRKHVNNLIGFLREKEGECSNKELFLTAIKLYTIFGYDNSKKIIEDFYTYSTKASINRASCELALDDRRDYRLKNQDKFYYHGMENEVVESVSMDNYEILFNICKSNDLEYVKKFFNKLKKALPEFYNYGELLEFVRENIMAEIKKREISCMKKEILKNSMYYDSIKREKPLSVRELYDKFIRVDIKCDLSKNGQVIENRDLTKLLLGNYKRNNDCLMRMIFNKQALGLNDEVYNVINNFDKLRNIDLSSASLLDLIDFSKVLLYKLKPDELDITLNTLSKILNSRQFLSEPLEVIVRRVLDLHKERKRKVSSSIPTISGKIGDVLYEIPNFSSEELLAVGPDGGDCFKVGGPGEEFFRYCLTNHDASILIIRHGSNKYILPCVRTGNMVNINGISPKIDDLDEFNKIMDVVSSVGDVWTCDNNNSIDYVTITDMHAKSFMALRGYDKIVFDKFIPLNTTIYSDYMKKEVTNYIVSKGSSAKEISYEDCGDNFYQKRVKPYIYDSSNESDRERISIIVNAINYANINYLGLDKEEVKFRQEYYESINVDDTSYIVGNNDWFIALNNNNTITSCVLPYDERAGHEYDRCLDYVKNRLQSTKDVQVLKK